MQPFFQNVKMSGQKMSGQNLNILKIKRAFKVKLKAFFDHF